MPENKNAFYWVSSPTPSGTLDATSFAGLVLLVAYAMSGCGGSVNKSETHARTELARVDPDRTTVKRIVSKHDFGVVRPGTQHQYNFIITNSTEAEWTIGEVKTSCSCLAGIPADPVIPSHGKQIIPVVFHAGLGFRNVAQSVILHFSDPTVPVWSLDVTAKVRPPLVLEADSVDFGEVIAGKRTLRVLNVFNYGDSEWTGINIPDHPPWLTVSSAQIDRQDSLTGARQIWSMTLTALLPQNRSARRIMRERITCIARAPGHIHKAEFNVSLRESSPMTAIPSQLFFGRVELGKEVERKVTLRFLPDNAPEFGDDLDLHAELPCYNRLSVVQRGSGRYWTLSLTIKPEDVVSEIIRGSVRVSCRRTPDQFVNIPVFAAIQRSQ